LCLPLDNVNQWCHDLPSCDICVNDKLGNNYNDWLFSIHKRKDFILLTINGDWGFVSSFQQCPPMVPWPFFVWHLCEWQVRLLPQAPFHFLQMNQLFDFIEHKWVFTGLCVILSTIPLTPHPTPPPPPMVPCDFFIWHLFEWHV
jgi:hypothetical protein